MSERNAFTTRIVWTGNRGEGTRRYLGYDRSWSVEAPGKAAIHCSNDPALGGDAGKHNPEELLLAALSSCHMLWYLHLASNAGVIVTAYRDDPIGEGETEANGAGRFLSATLRPEIELAADADQDRAATLHDEVHRYCFIARSVNFPVRIEPSFRTAE